MPYSYLSWLSAAALTLGLVSGCAGQTDEQNKRLRELGDRLERLQATTDRLEERIGALESVQRTQPPRATSLATATIPSDLPLVKMAPASDSSGGASQPTDARSDEARTLIVGEGSRVEARPSNENSEATPTKGKTPSDKKSLGRTDAGSKRP